MPKNSAMILLFFSAAILLFCAADWLSSASAKNSATTMAYTPSGAIAPRPSATAFVVSWQDIRDHFANGQATWSAYAINLTGARVSNWQGTVIRVETQAATGDYVVSVDLNSAASAASGTPDLLLRASKTNVAQLAPGKRISISGQITLVHAVSGQPVVVLDDGSALSY